MKMSILVWFIFAIGDLYVCSVARAQPAPRAVLGVTLRELNPEPTQRGTNALGEYIVSDSSSYNPNIGSSTNWQALQRVP